MKRYIIGRFYARDDGDAFHLCPHGTHLTLDGAVLAAKKASAAGEGAHDIFSVQLEGTVSQPEPVYRPNE